MVRQAYLKFLTTFFAAVLSSCNIEIGNPEPPQSVVGFRSMNFSLSSYATCDGINGNCTSVPVVISDSAGATYRIEMTKIQFQLSSLQLQPFEEQAIQSGVDLLTGTSIDLGSEKNSNIVTGLTMNFAHAHVPTFEIYGRLRVSTASESFLVPISLQYRDALTVGTPVSAQNEPIAGATFDANAWFDFSDTKPDISSIIKNLTSGPCRTGDSTQCQNHRNILAQQIAKKISKSLSVKGVGKTKSK